MAETKTTNIVRPEKYTKYMQDEPSIYSTAFYKAGIIQTSADLNNQVATGGKTFNFPFFQNLANITGGSEVLSESASLSRNPITADKQTARRLERGINFAVNDLAKFASGEDPIQAIARQINDFWVQDQNDSVISIMKGVFADNVANDSSDLVNDISIADGNTATSANKISASAVIDTKMKLGDMSKKLTSIAMRSEIYANLLKLNLVDFQPTNVQNIGWGTYLGMTVIVDDQLPKVAGGVSGYVYSTWLFAPGVIGYGEAYNKLSNEYDRDSEAGIDILVSRKITSIHPAGMAWQESSVGGNSPTDNELATAANWDRVFEKKNIGFVELKTNG